MFGGSPAPGEENARKAALLEELSRLGGVLCARCHARVGGHDYVASVLLGYKSTPYCLPCAAALLGRDRRELLEEVHDYARRIDCFRAGWEWANIALGLAATALPQDAFADWYRASGAGAGGGGARGKVGGAKAALDREPDATWDAGDMSCGDLVLELRLRLRALPPGAILAVTARDPGAPADLPAWCGLTGHTMLEAAHPHYRIERKAE
ncbi:MAG: sulfurtransferase TusA family protein [Planctomycetes bacterium]|nr:sulfurtransferase TusA family protein [Planctomycetota bacterium]